MIQSKMKECEWEEIQPYVCYEKTLYHFLKRTCKVEIFSTLYMDRYKQFIYDDGPEPLLPYLDGINRIRSNFEQVYNIKESEIAEYLRSTFIGDVKGQVSLLTTFPDGNTTYTSAFIEAVKNEIVYISRSNAVMNDLYYPMPMSEFISLIGKDGDTITISTFKKNSDKVFEIDYQKYLRNPIDYVMRDILGYTTKNGNLVFEGKEIVPDISAFERLFHSFSKQKEQFIDSGIPKIWQLRMHKNISNKLLPVLIAWEKIIADDPHNDYHEMNNSINELRKIIDNLYKWFSICYSKTEMKFLNKYEQSLEDLTICFERFQQQAHSKVIANMEK
ncbi:TPA: hypothetical protein ACJUZJ_000555 [Streptococcus pneumoniae]